MPGDFSKLDPHTTATAIERGLMGTVFSNLVLLGADGIPQPDLAESWINPDPLTYEFTLREQARFHNGRRVHAKDIKFSLERILSFEGASRWSGMIADIDRVDIVNDRQVRITLTQPSAPFLHNLSYCVIVPEEHVDTLGSHPIGSGPFVFEEWTPNSRMRLSANHDFYVPGQPAVDGIEWIPMPEPASMVANLETGDIDIASAMEFVIVPRVQRMAHIDLHTPEVATSYGAIFFRHREPTSNLKLRQAIAHCVDRDAINRAVYFGLGDPDCNPYPVGHWARTDVPCRSLDVTRAKQLLTEAGYPNGLRLSWKLTHFPYAVKTAEITVERLKEIGVEIELRPMEIARFVEEVYVERDFEIASGAFVREFDPDAVIESVVRTGGGNNPGEYSNPEIDELLRKGRAELDVGKRREIYGEITRIALDEVAFVKTATHPYIWASGPGVNGLWLDAVGTANVALRTVTLGT